MYSWQLKFDTRKQSIGHLLTFAPKDGNTISNKNKKNDQLLVELLQ